ncbi:MAG: hypothetical protein QF570_10715 [Myxococcota bacterium]|jgi:hypothetical protein|nr:hypothetical protein [Myxococcota bacterium]
MSETEAARPTRKIKLTLSPEAEKYVRRDAPVSARRMAAGGALPLEPVELASVLFALLHDPDDQVKQRAQQSLEELPEALLETVLKGDAHPVVLSFFAKLKREEETACERIALNAATDDATIAFLAGRPFRRVVDIVSQNQERLMRCEAIVDALGENPLTGRAQIERILDFLGKPVGSEEGDVDAAEELSDEDAEAAVTALLGEEYAHLAKHLASESEGGLDDEALEGNLFAAIQKMSVMQKIKLARSGGKEARSLLIRDRNKIVYTSVIRSPKITDNEIVSLANNRNSPEEVLRIISMNRDYTKHYAVKFGLASNSKTPQSVAVKFLNYLQDKDLRTLTKSRDVSSVISTQARRILAKKGKT